MKFYLTNLTKGKTMSANQDNEKKILLSRSISTKAENANKVIKKNDRGEYLVIVGAVNHFNKSGEFYTAEDVKERFFKDNAMLMKRCKAGDVKIESEHPVQEPGMSKNAWFQRLYGYDKTRVAAIITELYLEETNEKEDGTNCNIILIWAAIKPLEDRELGLTLKKDLENPDINTAFSIRSIIIKEQVNFITVCKIEDIITFDWVSSPGIGKANTFYTAGMESARDYSINLANLSNVNELNTIRYLLKNTPGLENSSVLNSSLNSEINRVISADKLFKW